jgi:hypothetical protein
MCPDATELSCLDCGSVWEPPDLDLPGVCPTCTSERTQRDSCPGCELAIVEELISQDTRLQNALTLYEAVQAGFRIDFGDLTVEQYRFIKIIRSETQRLDKENARRSPHP